MRRFSVTTVALAAALCAGLPAVASAQIDLSGTWAPIFHEDQVERIPGPDVGDYAGLPINDAGAAARRHVGRVAADAARAPVQAAPVDLRVPRRRQPAD